MFTQMQAKSHISHFRNPDPGGRERPQQNQLKEVHTKTHDNGKGKKVIENFKNTKQKENSYTQWKPYKAIR